MSNLAEQKLLAPSKRRAPASGAVLRRHSSLPARVQLVAFHLFPRFLPYNILSRHRRITIQCRDGSWTISSREHSVCPLSSRCRPKPTTTSTVFLPRELDLNFFVVSRHAQAHRLLPPWCAPAPGGLGLVHGAHSGSPTGTRDSLTWCETRAFSHKVACSSKYDINPIFSSAIYPMSLHWYSFRRATKYQLSFELSSLSRSRPASPVKSIKSYQSSESM
jgi:hypothetical protein